MYDWKLPLTLLPLLLGSAVSQGVPRTYGTPNPTYTPPQPQPQPQPRPQPQPQPPPQPTYTAPQPQPRPQPQPQPRPQPTTTPMPMPFEFAYEVKDGATENEQSHNSKSDGMKREGSYSTLLPDGRTQTVTYTADKNTGFVATVEYSGEVKPTPPRPSGGGGAGAAPSAGYTIPNPRGRQLHASSHPRDISYYGLQKRESDFSSVDLPTYEIAQSIDEYSGDEDDDVAAEEKPRPLGAEKQLYHHEIPEEEVVVGRSYIVPFLQNFASARQNRPKQGFRL